MDQIKHGIKTVTTLYTEDRQPGVAKTCLKTCSIYAGNILKDLNDPKYQQINLENEAFQKRVGKINGGKMILKGFGFVEDEAANKLVIQKVDEALIKEGVKLLKSFI